MKYFKILMLTLLLCIGFQKLVMADDVLTGLGIMPAGVDDTEVATRELLPYVATKLAGAEPTGEGTLPFTDVVNSVYADYIMHAYKSGYINGVTDTMYSPDTPVTLATADAVMIRVLNCESYAMTYGDGMDGYVKLADSLGLNKNVGAVADTIITIGQLRKLAMNVLESKAIDTTVSGTGEIKIKKGSERYVTDTLSLHVYKGRITESSNNGKNAEFRITGVKYESDNNKVIGSEFSFSAGNGIDLYEWEYVESYIWVNEDDEILYIEALSNSDVFYTRIFSINGDEDEYSEYTGQYLNRVVLKNNEKKRYNIASDAVIRYNGYDAYDRSERYVNRFVKVVITDGNVVYMDCYDSELGGLVKSVSADEICYMQGDGVESRISDIADYRTVRVFIDGEKRSLSDIKQNSVIRYYEDNGDLLFIEISEKAISEVLNSVGSNTITIGGVSYDKNDTYFSKDGVNYTKNSGMSSLYNMNVTAYFDARDNCVYVRPKEGETVVEKDFLGALLAYIDEHDDISMKIYVLEPTPEKRMFDVANKLKYGDGVNINTLVSTAGSLDDSCIYLFETNAEGEISKVSSPEPVYGFNKTVAVTHFVDDAVNPYVAMSTDGGYKTLFFNNAPIFVLYRDDDGQVKAEETVWSRLRDRYISGGSSVAVNIYGRELEAVPRMVLLTGKLDEIYTDNRRFAVVTEKEKYVDDQGEIFYNIKIESDITATMKVSEEFGDRLSDNCAFIYQPESGWGKTEDIILESGILSLSKDPSKWDVESIGLKRGIVKRIDDKRLFVDDGTVFGNEFGNPIYMYKNFILEYDAHARNTKLRFKRISYDEVKPGSEVIYYLRGELRGMIVIPQ